MRNTIEGPELESVNFEEILDILGSLTGVFRIKSRNHNRCRTPAKLISLRRAM